MEQEQSKKDRVREIKRNATIESAAKYFDTLYDKHLEDNKKLKLKFISKDGKDVTLSRTEYEIPFQIDQIILALNGAFEMRIDGLNINRDNLKSIEILFE